MNFERVHRLASEFMEFLVVRAFDDAPLCGWVRQVVEAIKALSAIVVDENLTRS